MPRTGFNLENHNAFYEKMKWVHPEDCLCRRSGHKEKEGQKLKFIPTAERFEEPPQEFKNISE